MLEVTNRLKGANYVLWGEREGYETLLNTDLDREEAQFARFLSMVAEHKHRIGFNGTLLIEPKPQEPTKHQYDYDAATVHGFLVRHGLDREYRLNLEVNHATLAGHSFHHEVAYATTHGVFGSIDANRGDYQNGWDTDQFPNSVDELSLAVYEIVRSGGFTTGGFNFDPKLRRQSLDRSDLFHAPNGGIDISTTATKAVLVDETGAVRAIGITEYGFEVPHPLWSEQAPQLWWDATIAAVRQVLASPGVTADEVVAVGLTGQMHGAVLLDAADEVLRPAILWNDQRTSAECELIREVVGRERLIAVTGNDALTGFTAPKLVWVREREPDVWRRIAHVLLPKDYVRLRLTGDHAVDKADGAGTLLFDLALRDWSPEVVAALDIDPGWLPRSWEGPQVTGTLLGAAAEVTGLRPGTPVVAGGGDQSANAVGVGVVSPGTMALSLGTSGVVFAATEIGRAHV